MLKIVKCAWENSDVNSSVQDFQRLHFEIVTSAAASTPKEVRAYPQRGSGPVSQAHLERGLRLDLLNPRALKISMLYKNRIFQCMGKIFCVEFQSPLWNFTQNILAMHWKMYILFTGENYVLLDLKAHKPFWDAPPPPPPGNSKQTLWNYINVVYRYNSLPLLPALIMRHTICLVIPNLGMS